MCDQPDVLRALWVMSRAGATEGAGWQGRRRRGARDARNDRPGILGRSAGGRRGPPRCVARARRAGVEFRNGRVRERQACVGVRARMHAQCGRHRCQKAITSADGDVPARVRRNRLFR